MAGFELLTSGVGSNNSTNWVTTTASLLPLSHSLYHSIYLSPFLSIHLSLYLSVYLSTYSSIYHYFNLSMYQSILYPSITISVYLSTFPSMYHYFYLSIYQSILYRRRPRSQEPSCFSSLSYRRNRQGGPLRQLAICRAEGSRRRRTSSWDTEPRTCRSASRRSWKIFAGVALNSIFTLTHHTPGNSFTEKSRDRGKSKPLVPNLRRVCLNSISMLVIDG